MGFGEMEAIVCYSKHNNAPTTVKERKEASKQFHTLGFPGNGFWGDGGGSVKMLEVYGDDSVCVEEDKTISFWVR